LYNNLYFSCKYNTSHVIHKDDYEQHIQTCCDKAVEVNEGDQNYSCDITNTNNVCIDNNITGITNNENNTNTNRNINTYSNYQNYFFHNENKNNISNFPEKSLKNNRYNSFVENIIKIEHCKDNNIFNNERKRGNLQMKYFQYKIEDLVLKELSN